MTSYEALIAAIRSKRTYYEAIIRDALREAAADDPSLLTDAWDEVSTLEQFIEAHLYDLEGLPLDADPGIKWSYGQMYAADELLREIEQSETRTYPAPVSAAGMQHLVRTNGYACPRCTTQDVVEGTTRMLEGARYQEMRCNRCNLRWTNVWVFDRLLIFQEPAADPLCVSVTNINMEGGHG